MAKRGRKKKEKKEEKKLEYVKDLYFINTNGNKLMINPLVCSAKRSESRLWKEPIWYSN